MNKSTFAGAAAPAKFFFSRAAIFKLGCFVQKYWSGTVTRKGSLQIDFLENLGFCPNQVDPFQLLEYQMVRVGGQIYQGQQATLLGHQCTADIFLGFN